MTWESRNRKGSYFTLTIRGPKRRRRVYCGRAGSVGAELASTLVEIGGLDRQQREQAWAEEDRPWQTLEAGLEQFSEELDLLARASLLVTGYHWHRGEWRRFQRAK
jgi:hypothetical protein